MNADRAPDHFSEGMAYVGIKGRWGFVDRSGNIVIEPKFTHADSFSNGLARVVTEQGVGYVD